MRLLIDAVKETHVCEASESEGLRAYKTALEVALDAPSAPHPVEEFGPEGYSLAQARREVGLNTFLWRYCSSLSQAGLIM